MTQRATLSNQGYICNICKFPSEMYDYDHIDGNSSNNSIFNYQALCPNYHAKKSRKRNFF